ncbi:O-antigen ligase family protein [Thermotomaculum hydrothermale]|uniref:O-antigen ligase family protein n=1 Tax=Thermotomaculum hydrothermale TaxID=981385 RepID=UPI0019151A3E|nr:O-antigen ligase family protein [Thermotomaculum hydrothermale]
MRISVARKFFDKYVFLYLFALLLVRSRTNLLFVICLLFYYFLELLREKTKINLQKFYLFAIGIGFSLVWLLPILYPEIQNFFASSLQWRYHEWNTYIAFVKNNPDNVLLFGKGFGAVLFSEKPIQVFLASKVFYLERFHNIFLFLLFKIGIIGVFLYLSILYFVFKIIGKNVPSNNFYVIFYLVFLFFIGFPANGGFTMSVFIGMVLGVCLFFCCNSQILILKNE